MKTMKTMKTYRLLDFLGNLFFGPEAPTLKALSVHQDMIQDLKARTPEDLEDLDFLYSRALNRALPPEES